MKLKDVLDRKWGTSIELLLFLTISKEEKHPFN